jgi:ribulose-bisphosphate carboxylase large chain
LGSTDLIFAAGGGILAHADGPAAGVAELRAAWDAAIAGKSARALP